MSYDDPVIEYYDDYVSQFLLVRVPSLFVCVLQGNPVYATSSSVDKSSAGPGGEKLTNKELLELNLVCFSAFFSCSSVCSYLVFVSMFRTNCYTAISW